MANDVQATRRKLLDAAARLLADRGVRGASLAEIVKAAGQRNASAIHYHFGNREGLLEALVHRHASVIRSRRLQLLAVAERQPDSDLRSAVEALVRPVTELAQRG